jgi:O-antigen/teichoic acid export membrane protein
VNDLREGTAWVGSRVVNGILGLVQVSLAVAAVGSAEAGRFFLLWTGVWLLATVLKFGTEGILPRAVAEAAVRGAAVPSLRRPVAVGLLAGVALLPALLIVFRVPFSPGAVGVALGLAFSWAAVFVLSGLLKSYGKVAVSGVVGNVLWPLGPALAPLVLMPSGGTWLDLAAVTLVTSVVMLGVSVALAARTLGASKVRRLASSRPPFLPVERDTAGAALLSLLYELIVWLPVVIAALAGIDDETAAGVFAAARVAGVVSWPYAAVLAVLTPRLAGTLAARDLPSTRRTLLIGSLVGFAATLPAAVMVALAAEPILGLFDSAYETLAGALVLLAAGRLFDAAAGPVGEALLVGRKTWLDASLVGSGIAVGAAAGILLEPGTGATAVGVGGAGAYVVANTLRVAVVSKLLRSDWRWRARPLLPHAAWRRS